MDSNHNGKRYHICYDCDGKYLNLQLNHVHILVIFVVLCRKSDADLNCNRIGFEADLISIIKIRSRKKEEIKYHKLTQEKIKYETGNIKEIIIRL